MTEIIEKSDQRSGKERKAAATPNVKLRRQRELRGWSQALLAEKIDAQTRLITRWETGTAQPSPHYRKKLCETFGQNAEELGLISAKIITADPVEEGNVNKEEKERETEPITAPLEKKRLMTRRNIIIGLLAGATVGTASVSTWLAVATQNNRTRATPTNKVPTLKTEYIYKTSTDTDVNYAVWSPLGHYIACANGDNTAQILDATTGAIRFTYREHTKFINGLSWSPDETKVVSASGDRTVRVWSFKDTNATKLIYRGHKAAVLNVSWSPDGSRIASSSKDTTVHVWDAFTGQQLAVYHGHTKPVWPVVWSPDNASIASGGDDGTVQIWHPITGEKSQVFLYQGPVEVTVNEISWSPDGKYIMSANANGIAYIWNAMTGEQIFAYHGHKGNVMTARYAPNGKYIASAGDDKSVQIWNAINGKLILNYKGHTDGLISLSWSPDSSRVASGGHDHSIHVIRLDGMP